MKIFKLLSTLIFLIALSSCGENANLRMGSLAPQEEQSQGNSGSRPATGGQIVTSPGGHKIVVGINNISGKPNMCGPSGHCMQVGISR